jgi:TonB family protein
MMSGAVLRTLILGGVLLFAPVLGAQTPAPAVEPAISEIAARIAAPIQEQRVTRIIVADLRSREDEPHPAGKWLAGQLAQSLRSNFPNLEVLATPDSSAAPVAANEKNSGALDPLEADRQWSSNLHANVVITGVFARNGEGVGISLWAVYSSGSPRLIGQAQGSIPVSDEFAGISLDLAAPSGAGAARPGVSGTTVPVCVYCPTPIYSREANKAHLEGAVILQITVTSDGRASKVMIVRGLGLGLEEQAVKTVRTWTFKPAMAPNGEPTAVVVPIQVTFQLYNK